MGSRQSQDPFADEGREPFDRSDMTESGLRPDLPAPEQKVVECLLSEGSVSHEVGDGSRRLEVRARLWGNNREWKYRVVVVLDGKEVEDPVGVYPTEKHFPRDLGSDSEDGGDGSVHSPHRIKAAKHAARCHLDVWTHAHRLLPEKASRRRYWLWIPVTLVLASAAAAVAYYFLSNQDHVVEPSVEDRPPTPPTPKPNCTQTPTHPDCPQPGQSSQPQTSKPPTPDLGPYFK